MEKPQTAQVAEWSERRLSNQRRFLADVPRLLGRQLPDDQQLAAG